MTNPIGVDNPWDHNGECRFCDEQAMHTAECPWVAALIEQLRDYAAKIQFLVDWADDEQLLGDHVFTFPDGDIWEAKK